MSTLYLCGAGNPEGVRLAIVVNRVQRRWDRIILLDDDPSKHGQSVLGVQIVGPFEMLQNAHPDSDEVVNMIARTTVRRQAAWRKIAAYPLRFATLVDPNVDVSEVELGKAVTIYQNTTFCATAYVDEASVILTGAVVGHGCSIGRCCVIAPGAVINARVQLGEGVYVGTNASILPDLKVGPWATIGANSAVVQNVPDGATVMGVPAQVLGVLGGTPGTETVLAASAASAKGSSSCPSGDVRQEETEIRSEALRRLRIAQHEFIKSQPGGR
jgi:sugar O-acyltransferase (sialic acid O-acetyltransferase NeuD family)